MNRIASTVTLTLLILLAQALPGICEQTQEPESYPLPVGGMTALMQAVEYPKSALKDGTEGKVLVEVIIDANGNVKSAVVKTGVRADLDKAALAAINKTAWTPALKNNAPVESTIIVPIMFKLDSKKQK